MGGNNEGCPAKASSPVHTTSADKEVKVAKSEGKQDVKTTAPVRAEEPRCRRPGCGRATWNGKADEYCSRTCQRAALRTVALPAPSPQVVTGMDKSGVRGMQDAARALERQESEIAALRHTLEKQGAEVAQLRGEVDGLRRALQSASSSTTSAPEPVVARTGAKKTVDDLADKDQKRAGTKASNNVCNSSGLKVEVPQHLAEEERDRQIRACPLELDLGISGKEVEKKQKAVGKRAHSPTTAPGQPVHAAASSASDKFPVTVPTTNSWCIWSAGVQQAECSLPAWENYSTALHRDVTAFSASDCRPFFPRSPTANGMVTWSQGDILELDADMIVIPKSGNLCNRVKRAAGAALEDEYRKKNDYGSPVLTCGHKLKTEFVLFIEVLRFADCLKRCCQMALDEAVRNGVGSVALPCLVDFSYSSSAAEAAPAAHVVLKTVREWIARNEGRVERVILVTYGTTDKKLYRSLLPYYFPRHGDYECKESEDEVEVTITWNEMASTVSLSTSMHGWSEMAMEFKEGFFCKALRAAKGSVFYYRFCVDNIPRVRKDQPCKDSMKANVMDLNMPRRYF